MYLMIMSLSFMMSFIFMNMKHPLAMGLTLLIQTFLVCLMTGMFLKTFWFSYILFLIFMGGMLVLFIYVTSLSSNEMFSLSFSLSFIMSTFIFIMLILFLFIDNSLMNLFLNNNEMSLLENNLQFFSENSIQLNKLYNFPTNMITLLLINYLFLTLLMTIKITKKNYGPLRPMN
uniref:NADH-ubiquinone oxidoreductase chain 6 n=1 Tax=Mansonia amazonensis TaxID=2597065 RepID=A0A5B9H970_9DIPT|nr:NADH dehydrogenase subunit 6 [Mansonia amazonensis]QEE94343.1 NADH dehydrogenase subunit 6 [Mansonia amazonensis]